MLVGNLLSIFVGGIITILWSFVANWSITNGEPSEVRRFPSLVRSTFLLQH